MTSTIDDARNQRCFLIIAPDFYPTNGGYANAATTFVKALVQHGNSSVTVVTPGQPAWDGELELDGLRVQRLKRYRGRFRYRALVEQVRWGRVIAAILASEDYDFVLFETLENPISLYLAVRGLEREQLRRVAIRVHATSATEGYLYGNSVLHRLYWQFLKRAVARIPNVLATTDYYIKFVKEKVLLNNVYKTFKNYTVLPNIVLPALADRRENAKKVREGGRGALELLCLGRLNANGYNQKNFELVLQSVFLMRRHDHALYQRVRVTLVGSGEFSGLLLDTAARLGVGEHLAVKDGVSREEVRQLQKSAAAVLLVSRYEGQSMFALEALAAGAPLVVAKDTGVEHLVEEAWNGFRVDPDDPYSLVSAIARIAEVDLECFGQRSREIYNQRLRPEMCIQRFVDFSEMSIASHKIETF